MAQEHNLYSIIIPVLDITDSLIELHKRIDSVMSQNSFDYELIFIDDGSSNEKNLSNQAHCKSDQYFCHHPLLLF